jgi:hypothetical protein
MMYMCCDTGIFYFDEDLEVWRMQHSLTDSSVAECGDSVLLAAVIVLAGHTENHHKLRCGGKVYSIPYQGEIEETLSPYLITGCNGNQFYSADAVNAYKNKYEVKK